MSNPSETWEEDDDFDEVKRPNIVRKSLTPVLDHFSQSFETIVKDDVESGILYYKRAYYLTELKKGLLKHGKQNICLIGEPGVGKKTIVKILANQLIQNDIESSLFGFKIVDLNFEFLVAGTKYRGQFEERLKAISDEIQKSTNLITYVADLFKLLNRDDLKLSSDFGSFFTILRAKNSRIITSCTNEEWQKLLEKDSSLNRQFNLIRIPPTNKEETIEIISTHKSKFEKLYSMVWDNEFIAELVEYCNLYVPDDSQPLKSLTLLEEICATKDFERESDPTSDVFKRKKEYSDLTNRKNLIKLQKEESVKDLSFEKAANLRDEEKRIDELIDKAKENIISSKLKNIVPLSVKDIVNAVSNITGIEPIKIQNKEKIDIHLTKSAKRESFGLPKFEVLQAQSILQGNSISIKPGLAFVLIPFNDEFDNIYEQYIKPSLEVHGLTVLKADSIYKPGNILSQIWGLIRSAEVVIADVSGKNANVIFELGLCYGIQRCPILLTRDPEELPFNLRNLRYIQYQNTAGDIHKLKTNLTTAVGEFLSAVRFEN